MLARKLFVGWLHCRSQAWGRGHAHATGLDSNLGENTTFNDYGKTTTAGGGIDVTVNGYARVFYCVQLTVSITVTGTYNTVLDFADTPELERVAWLLQ